MESGLPEYIIIFVTTYALTALSLLAYKTALNDVFFRTRRQLFREIRAVHPIALLSGLASLVPLAAVRNAVDSPRTTFGVIAAVCLYFVATLMYRHRNGLKLIDFSIDNGSNFNDEVNGDPTIAQKIWLFLVSWAGAITLGAFFGLVVGYNSWDQHISWLTDQPQDEEARIYSLIFGGLIFVAIAMFIVFRSRRFRRLPTAARIRRAVNRTIFLPATFGLMIALLMDFTRNTVLTNRYWALIFFAWIVLVALWNFVFLGPNILRHLREDRVFFELQQKRLRRQRNKKRKRSRR